MSKKQSPKELDNGLAKEAQEPANQEQGVLIPVEIVEALLVSMAYSNRVATASICEQIRELAQDQMPDKFPG